MTRGISQLALFLLLAGSLDARESTTQEGIAAFNQGRYSLALSKLSDAKDTAGKAFLALTQAALGDCKTALPYLVTTATDDLSVYRLTSLAAAKCESALGKDNEAFARLALLRERFPNDPDVLYTSAKLHMKAFNDATFAMFERAPSSYRVHELSAEIFEIENRYADAIGEYRKAIELNPNAPDLHFRLGRAILLDSHRPETLEAAAAEFRSELKLSPEDSACEFQLGQIALVKDNKPEAKSHFERALSLSPGFIQAMIALGKLYSAEKNNQEAIRLLSRATQAQPSNESAHYALMTAYRNNGQLDKAKSEKEILDRLQKPPDGQFADFLKKLGAEHPPQ
ncbi:MAG: tetratricopeptide repeat protein [Acidobacteriaceae bacterium]|nr:tetratricopeptide repeat protein [Acidobacteriaceae bacterium]